MKQRLLTMSFLKKPFNKMIFILLSWAILGFLIGGCGLFNNPFRL